MFDDCIPVEDLASLDELPEDNPRRRHVRECPRCRARNLSYRSFADTAAPPSGARVEEAREELDRLARAELSPVRRTATPRVPLRRRWWPAWMLVPAGAVVALLVFVRLPHGTTVPPPRLPRGTESPTFAVLAPRWAGPRTVAFAWHPVAGADSYRVSIYRADLSLLWSGEAIEDTACTVALPPPAASTPPPGPGSHADQRGDLVWKVTALARGGVLSESSVGILPRR